jgi:DNA-directed RNA polymerase subunit RPC12/RpoP
MEYKLCMRCYPTNRLKPLSELLDNNGVCADCWSEVKDIITNSQ